MLDIRIEPVLAKDYVELRQPNVHSYPFCCTTTGVDQICANPEIAYKVCVDGWITKDPFFICRKCYKDWMSFGLMALKHHPPEIIRGPHVSVYPQIETLTVLRNTVDDRIRQPELTPKALEIKEFYVKN